MLDAKKLERLREVISENLRVQLGGDSVDYISVGTALQDAKAKQNQNKTMQFLLGAVAVKHCYFIILAER